jgi:hypothetical protein
MTSLSDIEICENINGACIVHYVDKKQRSAMFTLDEYGLNMNNPEPPEWLLNLSDDDYAYLLEEVLKKLK